MICIHAYLLYVILLLYVGNDFAKEIISSKIYIICIMKRGTEIVLLGCSR